MGMDIDVGFTELVSAPRVFPPLAMRSVLFLLVFWEVNFSKNHEKLEFENKRRLGES